MINYRFYGVFLGFLLLYVGLGCITVFGVSPLCGYSDGFGRFSVVTHIVAASLSSGVVLPGFVVVRVASVTSSSVSLLPFLVEGVKSWKV